MSKIPADVMKAARDAAGTYNGTGPIADIIARAIMAERERCAAFIEATYRDAEGEELRATFIVPEAKEGFLRAWHQASDIAAAIRGGTE